MNRIVRITAPSRLHFGLLRFAQEDGPSFGGLGMMIDQPATVVELQKCVTWQAAGPNADRAEAFAQQAARFFSIPSNAAFRIEVKQVPPAHSGLGSGTQLALAVARGICELCNFDFQDAEILSTSVGRGRRSAIGSHGFLHGGLLWETGRLPAEHLSKLTRRLDVPEQWRILLITPPQEAGLHGDSEIDAFASVPPVPAEVTVELQRLTEDHILPAVQEGDFAMFSEALYQYGLLAGNCFASVQGGPYASQTIEGYIRQLRVFGLHGVGQSSWGPTVFAFTENQGTADALVSQLRQQPACRECRFTISKAHNLGATVEVNTLGK